MTSDNRCTMRNLFTLAIVLSAMANAWSQEITDPRTTEVWEPEPGVVMPGTAGAPPSDAIILFNGKDLSQWTNEQGEAPQWKVDGQIMTVVKGAGNIKTKRAFGDVQLHIEWRTPSVIAGEGQERGNSGIFLQERYELQVLDSYSNRTYSNGQAGAIYKQAPPAVNASRPPGEWQVYDVIFTAPRYNDDGALRSKGRMTVLHNGVLIQDHTEIQGTTENVGHPRIVAHGKASLMLQDHDNPVSYRNIWIREL